ncbi:AEC family transporter [Paracoccus sulfuroxidans]|uniref:AEC family transporter n=1 Tax=Paracoccus sulfuroxidans TaxID=384678 RepID=A0A562NS73_9RHOB|nr:AEC family transporter [Paracoccus sulfuroxidans]TWI34973.1 hypothetical protein IQ24_01482 [Paracoccus sulfuroxidans]
MLRTMIDGARIRPQCRAMSVTASVLPVALVILIGHLARRSALVPENAWPGVEIFCYRILYPAIMLISVYRADLNWTRVGPYGISLLLMTAAGGVLAVIARLIWRMPDPQFTTVFQAVTRWNSFIGLALGASIMGTAGNALISVGIAFLIPIINVVNILLMAIWGTGRGGIGRMLLAIATNPLILGCMGGLALNLGGIRMPEPLAATLDMIGTAAISVSLLIVGAGVQVRRLWSISVPLGMAVGLRLLAMPLIFLALAQYFGLSPDLTMAGMIIASVPTAANGYLIARQMGGDAELFADILSWQTVLSVLSIPFVLSFVT